MKDLKSFKIRKKNMRVIGRDDGPVVEWPNRMTVVCKARLLWDDGPVVEWPNRMTVACKARLLWGDDWVPGLPEPGPVVEYSDDKKAWYKNSKCYPSGKGYFLRGPGC